MVNLLRKLRDLQCCAKFVIWIVAYLFSQDCVQEYGVVHFEFDSGGPSVIDVWIPSVTRSGGQSHPWQPSSSKQSMGTVVEQFLANHAAEPIIDTSSETHSLLMLRNKKPKWDEQHGGHVLNFQGRVTMSSVKNFQLCMASSAAFAEHLGEAEGKESLSDMDGSEETGKRPNDVILQFGKVGADRFTMDVQYPLSIYQVMLWTLGGETLRQFGAL